MDRRRSDALKAELAALEAMLPITRAPRRAQEPMTDRPADFNASAGDEAPAAPLGSPPKRESG